MKLEQWLKESKCQYKIWGNDGTVMLTSETTNASLLDVTDYSVLVCYPGYIWMERLEPEDPLEKIEWHLQKIRREMSDCNSIRWGSHCRIDDKLKEIESEIEFVRTR